MCRRMVRFYALVFALLEISINLNLSAHGESHDAIEETLLSDEITIQAQASRLGVSLFPPRLQFGRAALGAAHARSVTLVNAGNDTLHLAALSGTTPDFHASFFHDKSVPAGGNTSFSVVFAARREGWLAARLSVRTSRGPLHYGVSGAALPGRWGLGPLSARVPLNASVTPLLAITNPTAQPVQVLAVYSSARWLGLQLPSGGDDAPRALWTLPPLSTRPLVRLNVRPPRRPPDSPPLTAYVRVKLDLPDAPTLVVPVEAHAAPAGLHVAPVVLRAGLRGDGDPPLTFSLSLGNSADEPLPLEAEAGPASCRALDGAEGVRTGPAVSLRLAADAVPARAEAAAALTLDWRGVRAPPEGLHCSGDLRVGPARVPYTTTLLPGTLSVPEIHFVTGGVGGKTRHVLRVRNEFSTSLRVEGARFGSGVARAMLLSSFEPRTLRPDSSAALLRLRLRNPAPLRSHITLVTNVTEYAVPVYVYSGRLQLDWERRSWCGAGELCLGLAGVSTTRRVTLRVYNPAPAAVCVTAVRALGGGAAALGGRGCIPPGGSTRVVVTLVAPAAPGPARGRVLLLAEAGGARLVAEARWSLRATRGALSAAPVRLERCAPLVPCAAPLLLHSSMDVRLRVQSAGGGGGGLSVKGARAVRPGTWRAGWVMADVSRLLPAHLQYTGMPLHEQESFWSESLSASAARVGRRVGALGAARALAGGGGVRLRAEGAGAVRVPVRLGLHWPRLSARRVPEPPPAPLHSPQPLPLLLRNPSPLPLRLQIHIDGDLLPLPDDASGAVVPPDALPRAGWFLSVERDLTLQPRAARALPLYYTPRAPGRHAAYVYIRNNLTILESVLVVGTGAAPRLELVGAARRGLVLDVTDCGGEVARPLLVRNSGAVPAALPAPSLGVGCVARGFSLEPCAPLVLQPNETRRLTVTFKADWTLARAAVTLTLPGVSARLAASVPARLLQRCSARQPPPPWEHPSRAAATASALAIAALTLALAALDAEGSLERALAALQRRQARPPAPAPFDLRALAAAPPPALVPVPVPAPPPPLPPPPPPRRRRPHRRAPPPPVLTPPRPRTPPTEPLEPVELVEPDDSSQTSTEEERPPSPPPSPPPPPDEEPDEEPPDEEPVDEEPPSEDPPSSASSSSAPEEEPPPPPPPAEPTPPPSPPRASRPPEEPAPRRAAPPKYHKRDKPPSKRRSERPPGPVRAELPPAPPPPPPPVSTAVRRGATFSEVVSRAEPPPPEPPARPPQPPIGSARRPAPAGDHSLFYFNGAGGRWERAEGAGWAWEGGAWGVRPPPGFGAAPVRAFDPFHALAAIWAPDRPAWTDDDPPPPQ